MRIAFSILLLVAASHVSLAGNRGPSADTVVRELYREIVARKPLGIPKGADKAAISPSLSRGLIQGFELAQACEESYFQQHADQNSKPAFDWLEIGLFSGANEQALPSRTVVERTVPQKDGSVHVYVRLTYEESWETYGKRPNPANTFDWRVAAVVISEDGKFAVDDVLFFKDGSTNIESRLTGLFRGCDGSRWVGDQK